MDSGLVRRDADLCGGSLVKTQGEMALCKREAAGESIQAELHLQPPERCHLCLQPLLHCVVAQKLTQDLASFRRILVSGIACVPKPTLSFELEC